ncbi:AIPR family protein [Microvirga sesbaniae]|uniref:AIPR family protein n=1 Tax=Microvirga sesbaniae TaxID=681392 RepID=UPI0021CA079D|nr:AIPR family protein [Microvirga sp. HBU67692]
MSDLQQFIADFNGELLSRSTGSDGSGPDFKENVFTELMLEMLAEQVGIIENERTCYFEGTVDRGRCKINGYATSDEEDTLDLFVSIFLNATSPMKVPGDEVKKSIEQAARYFRGAINGLHKSLEPATDRYAMTARIAEIGTRISRVRVFILTDGVTGLAPGKLPAKKVGEVELRFEVWDMERLSRAVGAGPSREIDIDVAEMNGTPLPCVSAPLDGEYAAFVTVVPGTLLFRLYDEFGPRLLERNVRSFLQAKGKVNRGIRETLRQSPERFMAYNNGISMTAEEVETILLPGGQPALSRIKGLQVVNGGQTTASIHRAGKQDKADLSKVFVQAKLTVVKPDLLDDLAPQIAAFANTQNPIQMADFSANDPFHIELERLSDKTWIPGEQGRWFYERARGQYLVAQAKEGTTDARLRQFKERTPPQRKFTKIDLAKFMNAWDQLPHQVSLGGQKNFVLFMQRLRETRPKTWKPDDTFFKELIAKAILFNETTRIVRKEEFEGYRANIVAYTVSMLAFQSGEMLDLLHVWQQQRISTGLENLIRSWSHQVAAAIVESSGTRNVTEWCKKADCWKAVRALELALPDNPPPEFQKVVLQGGGWGVKPTEVRVTLDPDELDAIQQCRRTDPADWIRIIEWGTSSGLLDPRQREVASELAAVSAGGWAKDVSGKKAREGRTILNAALENGILEADRRIMA